ncbi:MAG: LysM peptidoglycan-binding domain-containing protein [Bacilli bacterium]|nr:LysM peptidoglycan-binding domain-containing protein [Bacilli bacterium]
MYKIYQVEVNETLESIANKLNTNVDTLKEINGIVGNVSLMPGSFIIVPMLDDRFITYIVKDGDTIYKISSKYNIDPNLLLELNGLGTESFIYPNQELMIPNNNYNYYITESNDTIFDVANKLGKSIQEVLSTNERLFLEPGQMIIYK